jgi:hypothetical protein
LDGTTQNWKEMVMATATSAAFESGSRLRTDDALSAREGSASGLSWSAVAGGAFIAASLSLVLLALGAGLGLSSVSPWSNSGASSSAIGTASILWLIVTEIIASSMGGYLAGRLRTRWTTVHSDEVHFRDTAHGFLVWAVAVVISASFLASAAVTMVGGSSPASTASTASNAIEMANADPNAYYVDSLFRSDRQGALDNAGRLEAARIFTTALAAKEMAPADRSYLAQMVANRTGINQPDADKRVSDVLNSARQAVDAARKAAAHLLLWLFIALLIGAFCASYAATIGGRQRDHVKAV